MSISTILLVCLVVMVPIMARRGVFIGSSLPQQPHRLATSTIGRYLHLHDMPTDKLTDRLARLRSTIDGPGYYNGTKRTGRTDNHARLYYTDCVVRNG